MNRPKEDYDKDGESYVKHFDVLTPVFYKAAGGKGNKLAKMYQLGYPVPEGFIILPSAFENDQLKESASRTIKSYLNKFRKKETYLPTFAVRSSALNEDSTQASFAGGFETILNVTTDEEIFKAIEQVYQSTRSERVKVYSSTKEIEQTEQIAIIVQLMIQAEISGVLFTADPINGNRQQLVGNFLYGLGEQLVSGESNAHSFTLTRPRGEYNGPPSLQPYASTLYQLAIQLEQEEKQPLDLEWAISNNKLYLLQARPITTLTPGNPDKYEWNDTFLGDFVWTNTNVGEAIPDIMTPMTWSLVRLLDNEVKMIPDFHWTGNICGRIYLNISHPLSVLHAFGITPQSQLLSPVFNTIGKIPPEVEVPFHPFTRWEIIKQIVPKLISYLLTFHQELKNTPAYIEKTPAWCLQTTEEIYHINTKKALLQKWKNELYPYLCHIWLALLSCSLQFAYHSSRLSAKLSKLVGTEDANLLLSNLRGTSGLASLGPVIGISNVIKGKISREEYLRKYGHRGPDEFELSIPHPSENPTWLETQIQEFLSSNIDIDALLKKQQTKYEAALSRFQQRDPSKVKGLKKKIVRASQYAAIREAIRSEFVRVYRVIRSFLLQAGKLTGLYEDIFFIYLDELISLLSGETNTLPSLQKRKENYQKYKTLPPLPTIIRGRFDPFQWAKDPERKLDYYDVHLPIQVHSSEVLKGFPGAAGRVEGIVRVLSTSEEGTSLLPGEILVTSTTNIGWTPLFPKAAAIITDIGAPLSHAAIVARELGIPAVVGCGNATTRLKTGDRVIVDGGQGIVQIVDMPLQKLKSLSQ
jgi:phosphohistidine swiveling domain-containing protein